MHFVAQPLSLDCAVGAALKRQSRKSGHFGELNAQA